MSLTVDIHKRYESFELNISFEAEHETLGFLGASGCGKSLTLRSIAGIETPDEGKIVVNGKVYFDKAAGKKAAVNLSPQKRKSALLFQNYQLFPNLSVEANIAAGIPKDVLKQKGGELIARQLQRFGLEGFEKRYPLQLSGGQQQRVALARMLAAKPDILMLDEPFSALDAHLKGELEQSLLELFSTYEGTILYVSHDIDEAFRFCDRIAVVDNGKIDELSPKDRLIRDPQSLAAIRLSGCKNTTPAEYRGDHQIYLLEWGVGMTTERTVPRDVAWLGVRAYHLTRVFDEEPRIQDSTLARYQEAHDEDTLEMLEHGGTGSERASANGFAASSNIFRMRCGQVSDSRFERAVMASFVGTDGETLPNSLSESIATSSQNNHDEQTLFKTHVRWNIDKHVTPDSALPQKGDFVQLCFPPEALFLVTH